MVAGPLWGESIYLYIYIHTYIYIIYSDRPNANEVNLKDMGKSNRS